MYVKMHWSKQLCFAPCHAVRFHDNKILWFGQGAEPQFMPFQALQEQTKIFRIFCILLQIRNNFQDILCFSRTFSGISDSFSAHSLLDLPRSTKHNILWFALHQQPCCFPLAPRRGAAVPRWKFPLKKASFSPFFHFQSVAKHAIICIDTAAHRRGPTALHRHAAAWFLIQRRLPHEKENFRDCHR